MHLQGRKHCSGVEVEDAGMKDTKSNPRRKLNAITKNLQIETRE